MPDKEYTSSAANRLRSLTYYHAHKEQRQAKAREWKTAHREECKAYCKAWNQAHPEKGRQYANKHRANFPEEVRARGRAYAKSHPEIFHRNTQRRRARKAAATLNDFTIAQWQAMQIHYGYRCVYCGKKPKKLAQDHLTPLSKGGNHTATNIVPACRSCNSRKHTGPPLIPIQPLLLL